MPNAVEALDLWFEDAPMMAPSDLDHIRDLAAQDLAEGAFLVAVPYVRTLGRVVRVNLSLDVGILDAIDSAAASRRLTRSAFLAEAARKEIAGAH